MLKDIALLIWCIYWTVMMFASVFEVENFHEVFILFFVWAWGIIIPVGMSTK